MTKKKRDDVYFDSHNHLCVKEGTTLYNYFHKIWQHEKTVIVHPTAFATDCNLWGSIIDNIFIADIMTYIIILGRSQYEIVENDN